MSFTPRATVLAIGDISGYTRFMVGHRKVATHGQMIIDELFRTFLDGLPPPWQAAKLEGDAVFFYATEPTPPEVLGTQLRKLYADFCVAAAQLAKDAICKCSACANIGQLKLKIVVHAGEALFTRIGPFTELAGVDVILLHRLLKNHVNGRAYMLLSAAGLEAVDVGDDLDWDRGEETYEGFDPVPTWIVTGEALRKGGQAPTSDLAWEILRHEIRQEYAAVATNPEQAFHFHTGRRLAAMLGYPLDVVDALPVETVASFAGTGNPFLIGDLPRAAHVVDIGCGAGLDTLLAARQVGPDGAVIGVDMTPEMLSKARAGAQLAGAQHVDIRQGFAEALPVPDGWADVVISNGVFNLCPDKPKVLAEIRRVLKPGGHLQFGDILVQKAIPEKARRNLDLWTG